MATLKVAEHGELVAAQDILDHLGLRAGDSVRVVLLPNGKAELQADPLPGSWDALRGFFDGKTNGAHLSIEDINEAIAEAGAEAGLAGLNGR